MPGWLMEVYADAIPMLQAREALQAVAIHAVGSGAADKGDRDRIIRDWRRDARGASQQQRSGPTPRDVAAVLGMKVTVEPPPPEEAPADE